MKKTLSTAAILVACVAVWSVDILACGEKFMVISRGTRFQRAGMARHSANILVYASASSTLAKSLAKAAPDTTLLKAGYRPYLAKDTTELDEAIRQGGLDLIVADVDDSTAVRNRLKGSNAAPMIIPVLLSATGTEVAQAKKDYQRVIKGPVRSQAFLQAIDDALALREKLKKIAD